MSLKKISPTKSNRKPLTVPGSNRLSRTLNLPVSVAAKKAVRTSLNALDRIHRWALDIKPGEKCYVLGFLVGGDFTAHSPDFTEAKKRVETDLCGLHFLLKEKILKLTEDEAYEIAKIAAAQEGWRISVHIQNYGIKDEAKLFEIAKIAVARDVGWISEHIQNYGIKDEAKLSEIAKIAAAQEGWRTSAYIQNYGIKDEVRLFEIAKIAAAEDGRRTSKYIQNYGIKDEAKLFEIAKIAAAQEGWRTSAYIQNYGIKDEAKLCEIAKIALLSDMRTLEEISNYGLGIKDFRKVTDFDRQDFIAYVKEILPVLGLEPGLAEHLYGDMGRRDAGVKLFEQLIQENMAGLSKIPHPLSKNLSRYLLAKLTGLDPKLLYNKKFSQNIRGDFYETCLSLQRLYGQKVFERIEFSPELFNDKSLSQVMGFLQNFERLKNILGMEAIKYQDTLIDIMIHWAAGGKIEIKSIEDIRRFRSSKQGETLRLTLENIELLSENIEEGFLRIFEGIFKIEGENLTMEMLRNLEQSWGNLDVLHTLVARYRSKSDWQKEIPFFAKVVKSVLNGTFRKLKYEGDPLDKTDLEKAAAQLAMLRDAEAKAGWMANYDRISVFNTEGKNAQRTETELLGRSKEVLEQQVVGHVKEFVGASGLTEARDISVLKQAIKASPKFKTIRKLDKGEVLLACMELLREAENIKAYRAILSLLSSAKNHFGFSEQLIGDLKTLGSLLKYKEAGNEAIVFSTTTDDPQLLLMVGNLVDATSCQDYRHGSYAHTLLGYVVDAGVKLVLSYALQPKHFRSKEEYEEAKRLIQQGVKPQFIHAKQILKIGSIEVELPKAYKRRVIKLGKTRSKDAGLFAEREYAQPHYAEKEMDRQIEEVLDELAEQSKAKRDEKITIPPSRNPLGIWSDAAHGVRTGEYSVGGGK